LEGGAERLRPRSRGDRGARAQGRLVGAAGRAAFEPAEDLTRRDHRPRARDAARDGGRVAARRGRLRPRRLASARRGRGGRPLARMTGVSPVATRGLAKRYGEIVAVDHVDLTVEAGDVFGYLGPNGAGKTTSPRMMLGLIR